MLYNQRDFAQTPVNSHLGRYTIHIAVAQMQIQEEFGVLSGLHHDAPLLESKVNMELMDHNTSVKIQ